MEFTQDKSQELTRMAMDEAKEALISLGYSPQDASATLEGIDQELPTEDRIRRALKGIR